MGRHGQLPGDDHRKVFLPFPDEVITTLRFRQVLLLR